MQHIFSAHPVLLMQRKFPSAGSLMAAVLAVVTKVQLGACKTKSEVLREQEMAQLKKEVSAAKGNRADVEVSLEEMRGELQRLLNIIEERSQYQNLQVENLRKELESGRRETEALASRIQTVESQVGRIHAEQGEETPAQSQPKPSQSTDYETGKKLYDAAKYSEAIEVLKAVVKKTPGPRDKKARFILAESYFATKQYAAAALEFGEFRRRYPADSGVPKAIYRQAQSFRNMNKKREARLFYQELIDKYPKSSYAKMAQKEL